MRKKIDQKIKNHLKIFSKVAESSFSPYFAENVMDKIDEIKKHEMKMIDFYGLLKTAFRKVAVIGAIVLFILISYNIKIGNQFSEEEVIYASEAVYNELNKLPLF